MGPIRGAVGYPCGSVPSSRDGLEWHLDRSAEQLTHCCAPWTRFSRLREVKGHANIGQSQALNAIPKDDGVYLE